MKKTKLKWTKKLPTVDGFYWWRNEQKIGKRFMLVVESGRATGIGLYENTVTFWPGQWYGPIPSKEPK